MAGRTPQQALCGGIFAVAGPVGLHIYRQHQASTYDTDQDKMMQGTVDLSLGIFDGIAQPAGFFARVPRAGAVQSQADEAAILEGLVAFGLVQRRRQSQSRLVRVHTLGAVSQSVISEGNFHTQPGARRRVHQPLQAQKAGYAQDTAHHHRPDHVRRGNLRMNAAVTGLLEVGFQTQAMARIILNLAGLWPFQRGGCCLRHSTSNSALAVRTSRKAS
jgi:hypothetical protein